MFEQNVTLGPGTATFTQHTFEILIMLLGAFLLGLWLGWLLWGRFKQMINQLRTENQSLSATADALRADLNAARAKIGEMETDAANMAAQVATLSNKNGELRDTLSDLEEQLAGLSARNRKVETELGLSFEPETLTSVADIPMEISLPEPEYIPSAPEPDDAGTPVEEPSVMAAPASDLLTAAQNLMLPDLSDDTELAGMAPLEDNPHWEAFIISDDDKADEMTPAPDPVRSPDALIAPERIEAASLTPDPELPDMPVAAAGIDSDDLTVIEGIGPKIQELLHQYGIRTYAELAETNVQKLKEILSTAGPQLAMHDPGTWPSQANLAANDEWESLKAIQSFLKGGKAPK